MDFHHSFEILVQTNSAAHHPPGLGRLKGLKRHKCFCIWNLQEILATSSMEETFLEFMTTLY
jgi:hypothetical protein